MTKIAFYSRVVSIEQRFKRVYIGGFGETAKFREEDQGYFMLLEGSYEALHIGFQLPAFSVGDRIKVTMERMDG